MAAFFRDGHVADLALALLVAELFALFVYRRMTGRGVRVSDIVLNALSGGFLLLALRAALTGSGWTGVAVWLLLALLAHVADLWRRWPRRR